MERAAAERALLDHGVLRREPSGALRTTPRWQAAVMRAAARLMASGDQGEDVRLPILGALVELVPEASDAEVAAMAAVVLPVEAVEAGAGMPRAAGSGTLPAPGPGGGPS
jgi:hypothetical protein